MCPDKYCDDVFCLGVEGGARVCWWGVLKVAMDEKEQLGVFARQTTWMDLPIKFTLTKFRDLEMPIKRDKDHMLPRFL